MSKPCDYQQPDATMTLREGLVEYQRRNPELLDPDEMPGDGGRFFRAHDFLHVLFGLDTSPLHETLADTWTIFGTTARLGELLAYYRDPTQREIIADIVRQIGYPRLALTLVRSVPRVIRVIRRSRRMSQKWPIYGHDEYLDVPLVDLRRRFNIALVA